MEIKAYSGRVLVLLFVTTIIAGCTNPYQSTVRKALAAENYLQAVKTVEGKYSSEGRNAVLYHLELAMVKHRAGEYQASVNQLKALDILDNPSVTTQVV